MSAVHTYLYLHHSTRVLLSVQEIVVVLEHPFRILTHRLFTPYHHHHISECTGKGASKKISLSHEPHTGFSRAWMWRSTKWVTHLIENFCPPPEDPLPPLEEAVTPTVVIMPMIAAPLSGAGNGGNKLTWYNLYTVTTNSIHDSIWRQLTQYMIAFGDN